MKKLILTMFYTMSLLPVFTQAQTTASNTEDSNRSNVTLYIYPYVGVAVHQPTGPYIKNFKQAEGLSEEVLEANQQFSNKVLPSFSPVFGVKIGTHIFKTQIVGTGIQYLQRGFTLQSRFEANDTQYQYDEVGFTKVETTVPTLEIPLWIQLELGNQWNVEGGISFGFPIKASSESTLLTTFDVFINGEKDDAWSLEPESEEQALTNELKNVVPGIHTALYFNVFSQLEIGAMLQYSGNYLQIEEKSIRNLSGVATLRYLLKL
ncbi:MAG: hypothetical protein AAF901_03920 [Bacteroidota bacterium]